MMIQFSIIELTINYARIFLANSIAVLCNDVLFSQTKSYMIELEFQKVVKSYEFNYGLYGKSTKI